MTLPQNMEQRLSELSERPCFCTSYEPASLPIYTLIKDGQTSTCQLVPTKLNNEEVTVSEKAQHPLVAAQLESAELEYAARLICISQDYSDAPLNVTREALHAIMAVHEISPQFLDIVSSFYDKVSNVEEPFCMPFTKYDSRDYIEYMYVFKYAERTGRPKDPWSIQQTGFYHKLRRSDLQSTYILINPHPQSSAETAMVEWMNGLKNITDFHRDALSASQLIFDTHLAQWRAYLAYYDRQINNIYDRLLSVNFGNTDRMQVEDVTELNFIDSNLRPVCWLLEAYQQLLNSFESIDIFTMLERNGTLRDDGTERISNYRSQTTAYRIYAKSLIEKCSGASQLLDRFLSFNEQVIAKKQTARLGYLTTTTVDDSTTVRIIGAITLGCLAFTVVAAVFAMPIFYLDDSHVLNASSSIWVFMAVAVPLTLLIVGCYQLTLRRLREARKKKLDDAVNGIQSV